MLDQNAAEVCAHGAIAGPIAKFQCVLEPAADTPRQCGIGVAHRKGRVGGEAVGMNHTFPTTFESG